MSYTDAEPIDDGSTYSYRLRTFSEDNEPYSLIPRHRGKLIDAVVIIKDPTTSKFRHAYPFYGEFEVLVLQVEGIWVIGPRRTTEEHLMEDLGPFENVYDALVFMRLSCTFSSNHGDH